MQLSRYGQGEPRGPDTAREAPANSQDGPKGPEAWRLGLTGRPVVIIEISR